MHVVISRSIQESFQALQSKGSIIFTITLALLVLLGQWFFQDHLDFTASLIGVLIWVGALMIVFAIVFIITLDNIGYFRAVFAQNLPELKQDCVTAIYYVNREAKLDAAVIKSSFEIADYTPIEINRIMNEQPWSVAIRSNDMEAMRGVCKAFLCVGVGSSMHVIESPQILLEIIVKDRISYWS